MFRATMCPSSGELSVSERHLYFSLCMGGGLVVWYGCETWSLTLREERKLRVFENMVLRRIFGPRRDEVTGNGGNCITRS